MDTTLFSFSNVKINKDLMNEIWAFDPNTLGSLDSLTISKYSMALAQYLVYFTYQVNQTKAILMDKRRFFDSSIVISLNKDILKEYKTKTAATEYLISTNHDLGQLHQEIGNLQNELARLEGMDRSISEFIATFKRELTRREKELFTTRQERR
jgi:hypothetical protein